MLTHTLHQRVLRSALASKLAYEYKPLYTERKHPQNKGILRIQTPGMIALTTGDNNLLVAFKGSTTIDDVATFFKVAPKEFRYREAVVQVHGGVLDMFRNTHGPLETVLPSKSLLINTSHRPLITFTGHSQGGSLAMFASAYYGSMYHNNVDIICHTFGTPRVGNDAFHNWHANYTIESINVIHSGDVVSRFPMGYGYVANPNQKVVDVGYCAKGEKKCNDVLSQHNMDMYLDSIRLWNGPG